MNNNGKLIFSLDVGSSKIVSLVGSIGERVNIIGLSGYHFNNSSKQHELSIMSNGLVCEVERAGNRVMQCVHEAQYNADCSAGSLITNISGNHVRNVYSHSHQEMNSHAITEDVIRYMVNEARQLPIPASYEVLDYEIQEYQIDEEHYTKNPLDLTCSTIRANINLFIAGKTPISNLKKAIRYSGYDIAKVVPSAVLSAMAVLNDEEKDLGCCLLDIGAGTTDVVVYESGFVRYLTSIPIGGEDITRDIANVLRISRNLAEDLKLTYGRCFNAGSKQQNDGINIIDHRGESVSISHKLLNDVIAERVREILNVVKTQLNNNNLYDIINSGVVVTGGVAMLNGLKEFTNKFLDLPVKIGVPQYEGEFSDIVCNPKYSTAVGALYFAKEVFSSDSFGSEPANSVEFSSIIKKIKNIFKNM